MSSIGFINFIIAKKNGIKVRIAHSHNSSTDQTLKGRVKRIMMLPYKYLSTINFACSTEAGKYLYGNKKFDFIPNSIDTYRFKYSENSRTEIRKKYNISPSTVLIGHIGRFNIQKNHMFLLDFFEQVVEKNNNIKLMLVGDGELKTSIQRSIKEKKLEDKVVLTGVVNNTWKYYSAFDIFVLPSLFEGLPVAGVEAQCSGTYCLFADNITREVNVTDLVNNLDLIESIWVDKIANFLCKYDNREIYSKIVSESVFNVHKLAKIMEEKYYKLYTGSDSK